ncbi:MAG TPA: multiheme c-type cytochrome [Blastocatellia bacterium]|nr:multiheme c-type cytochrome [Blastocatellia bacterium]
MKLKPRDFLFIAIVIVVVSSLYWLSTRQQIPAMSASVPEHQTTTSRDECLKCHLPEKMDALEAQRKHPLKWRDAKVSCVQCHKQAPAKTALNTTR